MAQRGAAGTDGTKGEKTRGSDTDVAGRVVITKKEKKKRKESRIESSVIPRDAPTENFTGPGSRRLNDCLSSSTNAAERPQSHRKDSRGAHNHQLVTQAARKTHAPRAEP